MDKLPCPISVACLRCTGCKSLTAAWECRSAVPVGVAVVLRGPLHASGVILSSWHQGWCLMRWVGHDRVLVLLNQELIWCPEAERPPQTHACVHGCHSVCTFVNTYNMYNRFIFDMFSCCVLCTSSLSVPSSFPWDRCMFPVQCCTVCGRCYVDVPLVVLGILSVLKGSVNPGYLRWQSFQPWVKPPTNPHSQPAHYEMSSLPCFFFCWNCSFL